MLDSNKDNLKLDAMKRIMIAKGRNASDKISCDCKKLCFKKRPGNYKQLWKTN